MFEISGAKRVKRSKLFSSLASSEDEASSRTSTPEPLKSTKSSNSRTKHVGIESHHDEESKNSILPNYGFEYEFVDVPNTTTTSKPDLHAFPPSNNNKENDDHENDHDEQQSEEQTYAFNLFAPTTANTSSTSKSQPQSLPQTITLRPITPPPLALLPSPSDPTHGSILHPRPDSHYFTSSLPVSTVSALKSQYLATAISGLSIFSASQHTPWPGTHLPWRLINLPRDRVTVISASITSTTSRSRDLDPSTSRKRTRPSKKRRIATRLRVKARMDAKLASVKDEEAEREKRTRRNREKKVKRKAREKAKKLGEAGIVAATGGGSDGGASDVGNDGSE